MAIGELTSSLDVAQVVLYVFWIFFAGLIFYLRREDRREGYPLESDLGAKVEVPSLTLEPSPKVFKLPHGGTASAPNLLRDDRPIAAERTAPWPGAALHPTGDPMVDAVGPAAYAMRSDEPELTHHGEPLIVPMRVAAGFSIPRASEDPRGQDVIGADGKVAGKVVDIWVDRADHMVRYLEVEVAGAEASGRVLVPMAMALLEDDPRHVHVHALASEHFRRAPRTQHPERVTLLEEDKISAFFAGGLLYATPDRLGPVL